MIAIIKPTTRLDDAANLAKWEALKASAAYAPKGLRRKRMKATRAFAHRLLKQELRGKRRR